MVRGRSSFSVQSLDLKSVSYTIHTSMKSLRVQSRADAEETIEEIRKKCEDPAYVKENFMKCFKAKRCL